MAKINTYSYYNSSSSPKSHFFYRDLIFHGLLLSSLAAMKDKDDPGDKDNSNWALSLDHFFFCSILIEGAFGLTVELFCYFYRYFHFCIVFSNDF